MKRKYSSDIYTIIKVNKNSVDIENDEVELNGVKKTDIIIIQESYNNKSEGVDKSNILSYTRR